jgi:tetratricopeptide (TPR) repeat protein
LNEIKDETRSYLFRPWLQSDREDEFKLASQRLVDYFTQPPDADSSLTGSATRINRIFHLIAVDRRQGFDEFEAFIREKRQHFALDQAEALLRIVHEYDPVLTPSEKAVLAYHEGKVATDRGRWDQASGFFEQVINTTDVDPALRIKALVRLGLVDDQNRRWDTAIKRFNAALAELNTVNDPKLSAKLRYRIKLDLGIAYRDLGDLSQAKKLIVESLIDARRAGSSSGSAVAYNSLGTLHRQLGESKRAIKYYEKSLHQLQHQDQKFRIGQVYNNLGLAYVDERQWEKGKEALKRSEEIKRQLGDTIGLARTYNNLMQVLRKQRLEGDAIHAGEHAVKLFKEVGDNYEMAIVLRNLGRLSRSLRKLDDAKKYFTEAINAFQLAGAVGDAASSSEEYNFLMRKTSLPWWAWVSLLVSALIVLSSVVLILIAVSAIKNP